MPDCLNCRYYHKTYARITMDAYDSEPAEETCDKDWVCPYKDENDEV
jgi:hypothetical protein